MPLNFVFIAHAQVVSPTLPPASHQKKKKKMQTINWFKHADIVQCGNTETKEKIQQGADTCNIRQLAQWKLLLISIITPKETGRVPCV